MLWNRYLAQTLLGFFHCIKRIFRLQCLSEVKALHNCPLTLDLSFEWSSWSCDGGIWPEGILESCMSTWHCRGQDAFYQSKSLSQGIGNIYPDFLYTTHFWCLPFATRNEEIVPVGKSNLWHWFCQLCFLGTATRTCSLHHVTELSDHNRNHRG